MHGISGNDVNQESSDYWQIIISPVVVVAVVIVSYEHFVVLVMTYIQE